MTCRCWPFVAAAPAAAASRGSFLLVLPGGCRCLSGRRFRDEMRRCCACGTLAALPRCHQMLVFSLQSCCGFFSHRFQLDFIGFTYFILGACAGEGEFFFFSFSFNFLASHWTFIFISWIAYVQLL